MTECGDSVCAPPRFRCIEWVLSSDFLEFSKKSWLRCLVQNKHMLWLFIVMPFPSLQIFPLLCHFPDCYHLQKFKRGKLHSFANRKLNPNSQSPLPFEIPVVATSRHSVIPTCNTTSRRSAKLTPSLQCRWVPWLYHSAYCYALLT